jgi:hypothetical protein
MCCAGGRHPPPERPVNKVHGIGMTDSVKDRNVASTIGISQGKVHFFPTKDHAMRKFLSIGYQDFRESYQTHKADFVAS